MEPGSLASARYAAPVATNAAQRGKDLLSMADEYGRTPLWLACQKGRVDAARSLLAEGAEVDRARWNGWTPLFIACQNGHVDAARLLLEKGADVNRANNIGTTPLYIACQYGRVDAARLLLQKGADVDRADKEGRAPLWTACWNGHADAARLLLEKGAEVDRARSKGYCAGVTPLYIACQNGHVDTARLLLDKGAEVDWADKNGRTSLFFACENGYFDAARLLLEKGAGVNLADENGWTPLYAACDEGHVDTTRLLLENGAEVDRAVSKGWGKGRTPLWIACFKGHVDSARLLLNKGAAVDRADKDAGATPLWIACINGRVAVVRMLLENADVQWANQQGRTLLDAAKSGSHNYAVVKLLEDHISKAEEPSREELDSLRAKVKSLEEANAKLKRRLDRHEGTVLDLTAEDSDDDPPPRRSKLRELHDKETTKHVEKVKKERDDHESRGELLDSMVTPLESQRRELQAMVSAAAEALMERDVPTRMLADDAAPFYYSQNSWEAEQEIPWNAEADRPMSLAEGIAWVHDNAKPPRKRRR